MNAKRLLWTMALGGLVACGSLVAGEATPGTKPDAAPSAGPRAQRGADRWKEMATELKLTDQQKTQAQTIRKEAAEKTRALQQNTSLTRQERQAKRKEIRDATDAKMKKLLQPDQYEKWQKMRQPRLQRPVRSQRAQPVAE
jgi:Spy/CpxP family protein refolding chaperone